MKVVHKFPLNFPGQQIALSVGFPMLRSAPKIVHFGFQLGAPHVWIDHVSDASDRETMILRIFATGEEIPSGWDHVMSAFGDAQGYTVWHLYRFR